MIDTILVIGGTGMLGQPVVRALLEAGFCVRLMARSPEKARQRFPHPVEIVPGDVEDPCMVENALRGCQAVHVSVNGKADPDLERRAAVAAVFAAREAGLERISYISGASVCEQNCWYPGTRAKYEGEQAIIASGVPYSIFRAHYFMETLPNFVRGKAALHIGRHPHPYPWVAAADYARMVARAYTLTEAADKIFYVCGPQALTMHQALEIFCNIVHPEAMLVHMPLAAARLFAFLGRRTELKAALPFFEYCEKVSLITSGSPDEANTLLGAPATTLESWSRACLASGV